MATDSGFLGRPRAPDFHVYVQPLFVGWGAALAALCRKEDVPRTWYAARISRNLVESRAQPSGNGVLASVALHVVLVGLLIGYPFMLYLPGENYQAPPSQSKQITYYIKPQTISEVLPRLAPAGPGGRPGSGSHPQELPARGSTDFHRYLTIDSNPQHPDNLRQTIIQSSSPPDLIIRQELSLPNLLVGSTKAAPMPRMDLRFASPLEKQTTPEKLQEPQIAGEPSNVPLEWSAAEIANPRLPVTAGLSTPVPAHAHAAVDSVAPPNLGSGSELQAQGGGLLILSVDPGVNSSTVAIPPGNRYGSYSISPSGGQVGSPGGVAGGGTSEGGVGGSGWGGDTSIGIGPGKSGGGGGNSGARGDISVSGGKEGNGVVGSNEGTGIGDPAGGSYPGSVFPIRLPENPRRSGVRISTGPVGGGGLSVYGILHGGKVYTIFLPMPGKNWVLEYCAQNVAAPKAAEDTWQQVVHMETELVPPDSDQAYDFKRFPIPRDKQGKMIVIHGIIQADGSVAGASVVQSVQPEMDKLAVIAFSRWKFKPALRDNKEVAVEILVGIPMRTEQ
ncbi:MAG: energy transducer TonB [Candidatus Acidiferrales bacterium]